MNYKKEYKKYLTSSILDTANNKIASSSLITAFAVYLGLSDLAIGIYAVLDTITNMLQIFAAPLFSKIGQSKIVVLSNYTIYRLASVGFAFIPFISDNITIRTIFFFHICINLCSNRRNGIYNICKLENDISKKKKIEQNLLQVKI